MMIEFTVTAPTNDLTLLSPEEQRVAAGLPSDDTSQDAALADLEAEIVADIVSDCGITSDGVHPPTLRSEGCREVFRLQYPLRTLRLSRRHAVVVSVEEDGTMLAETAWVLEAEAGKLVRLSNDAEVCWWASKITVVYTAGFTVVPSELKAEAKVRFKIAWSASGRDPLARSIRTDIPDIESRQVDYQVGGLSRLTDGLPDESARRLRRFMTQSMVY